MKDDRPLFCVGRGNFVFMCCVFLCVCVCVFFFNSVVVVRRAKWTWGLGGGRREEGREGFFSCSRSKPSWGVPYEEGCG